MRRAVIRQVLTLIPALLFVCGTSTPLEAQEDADETREQLSRLLAKGKTGKATALADKTFGKTWCETQRQHDFETASVLGVLARKAKRYDVALACSYFAHGKADSSQRLAATFFELSLLAKRASHQKLREVAEIYADCAFMQASADDIIKEHIPEFEKDKGAKLSAKARESLARDLLLAGFRVWPRMAYAKRLAEDHGVKKEALLDAMVSTLHVELPVTGPFASAKEAKEAARKKSSPSSQKPGEATKLEATPFAFQSEDCVDAHALLLELDGLYHVTILEPKIPQMDSGCLGYGEDHNFKKIAWVRDGQLLQRSYRGHSYIMACGPTSTEKKVTYYCDIGKARSPVCAQLAVVTHETGEMEDDSEKSRREGIRGSFGEDGKLVIKKVYAPKEVAEVVKTFEGKTLEELHKGLRPALAKLLDHATEKK